MPADLIAAARELQDFLRGANLPYCFIGGLAVNRWGEPRFTEDADVTVACAFGSEEKVVEALLERFEARIGDAREFALSHRVVLLRSSDGIALDVALGGLPFEERMVTRASAYELSTVSLVTCSAEDLVVLKVFAGRTKDWADVEGILARNPHIDRNAILTELRPLMNLKEAPEAVDRLISLFGATSP